MSPDPSASRSVYPAARFITSANSHRQVPPDTGAEVAFAGRSNAGKSSAINTILGRRDFARTSKTPGRTQLINFFALDDRCRLVDLPGYGFARVSHDMREHWRELLTGYFDTRRSLTGLMLVVDSRRGLTEGDWQMHEFALALSCPVHVLLTKADKLNRAEGARALAAARDALPADATVQLFSAPSRTGLAEARGALARLLGEAATATGA